MNKLHKQGEGESERIHASRANNSHLTHTQFSFPLHPPYGGSSLHSNKDGCDGLDTNLSQDFSLQLDAFLYRAVRWFSVQTQAHLQLPMRFKAHHLQSSIELISSLPFFLSVESQTLNRVWQVRLWPGNYLYSGFAWALSVRFSLSEMCHLVGMKTDMTTVTLYLSRCVWIPLDPQTLTQGTQEVFSEFIKWR